ncbi:hypothetical protein DKE46_021170 (plasmid) [Acinetobacter pittii]|nr:hypothetical protein DKE46_021170 [Acinetobacter pittii]
MSTSELSKFASRLSEKHFFALFSLRKLNFHAEICSWTERSEKKKLMSEANSELLLLFLKVTQSINQKLPRRTERKRSSIEFERSENQGQFFMT